MRAGDQVRGCNDKMVEAAIWIGVVVCGVAALGVVEYLRNNSFIRAHGEGIKAGLPFLFLVLLILITGSLSVFFFFLYFLAGIWKFSLAVVFLVFIFLVARIRKEQSLGALVAQPGALSGEGGATPTLLTRVATLAVEAAGAAMLMVFMIPFAAGGFLLFRFFGIILESMGITSPIFPLLLLIATIVLPYQLIIKRRSPPS